MNFLGHIYLSGPDTELAIGNLLADQIKGNRISELPDKIKSGIVLHRLIDEFTDNHFQITDTTVGLLLTCILITF